MSVSTRRPRDSRQENQIVNVVEVVRHGEALVVPESLTIEEAIQVLYAQLQYDEERVALAIKFDAFLTDGAYALQKALAEKYGWVNMKPTPGFFGDEPPTMIGVAISPTETIQVPWGRIQIPGIEGFLETGQVKTNDGRRVFTLRGEVKRKHAKQIDEIVALTRYYLLKESIYKGKAIRLRFMDDNGTALQMPEPKFMDLTHVREGDLIFSAGVQTAINASLFTPIERIRECRELGIPLKRGVLLAGPYGVGKTLAAYVAAHKAQENGWTFVYCETAPELSDVVRFAQQYAPAVVFCEDIDRVVSGQRDVDMDEILAIVDGIESKDTELLIVLTTNEVGEIHQSMLRPGRLDSIINVTAPDAEAVTRLIYLYARGRLAENIDLTEIGKKLEGQIPAVIRECVERAKLHALSLTHGFTPDVDDLRITSQALLDAAAEMEFALQLLTPKTVDMRSDREKAAQIRADAMREVAGKPTNHSERVMAAVAEQK